MARETTRETLESLGRWALGQARVVVQKAVASGAKSVAQDIRGVVDEGRTRLNDFIAGCEEIARQDDTGIEVDVPEDDEPPRRSGNRRKKRGARR